MHRETWAAKHALHPCHPAALHRRDQGAEDQADPAQRQGAAQHRHPARRHRRRSDYPVPDDLKDKIALFCDVDQRGVVPLETADTIYEVPLILEQAGPGRLRGRAAGLATPARRDLDEWRELVRGQGRLDDELRHRRRRQVRRAARMPTSACASRCIHAGWHHDRTRRRSSGSTPSSSRTGGRRAVLRQAGRHRRARRLRPSRCRGQDPGGALRPRAQGALPRALPRDAGACASSSPATCSARATPTAPSSTCTRRYPVIDLLPEQKGHRGQGRDDAAGRLPLPARAAARRRARPTASRSSSSGTAIASSSTTTIRERLGDAGLRLQRPLAGRAAGRDRRAGATTR